MPGPPRRRPYPADIVIDGRGYMLGKLNKQAALISTRVPGLDNVTPSDYSYSSESPTEGRIASWDSLILGYGLMRQETANDQRARHCINADTSAGVWQKGPYIATYTPSTKDTTNGIANFFEIEVSNVATLFALNGRYCHMRTSDLDWDTSRKDFGASYAATDVEVFYSNVSGGVKYAYVAMGDSWPIYRFDGATWLQCVEVQTVVISGSPAGGHYHLIYGSSTTGELAYNADAAAVQVALRLITGLESVTVAGTGTTPNFTHTVTFWGVTGNPGQLTSTNSLTGGSSPTITHATTQDHEIIYARNLAVVGRELYRAHSTNLLAKVDTNADPFVEDNWGAENAFRIGDKTSGITRLAVTANGALVVCKTDGVYSIDEEGQDHALFPNLKMAPDTDNGKATAGWLNDLYIAFREGTFRLQPDWSIQSVGPERLIDNISPVKGRITSMCGHDQFNLYAGVWDPDAAGSWDDAELLTWTQAELLTWTNFAKKGDSYVMKFGGWGHGTSGQAERIDAWHGSISEKFENKKITCMHKSTIGAPVGHSRLYLGFSDGSVGWFTLPCTANPAGCTQYAYNSADGEIYLPTWTGGYASDDKILKALTVRIISNVGEGSVRVQYRVTPEGEWLTLDRDFDVPVGETCNFPNGTSGREIDFKVLLQTGGASTPLVSGMGLDHAIRRKIKLLYDFAVLAEDGLVKRDGSAMRLGASKIRELVKAAADEIGGVDVVLPDETSTRIFFNNYGESIAWDERLRRWRGAVRLSGVEYSVSEPSGTWNQAEKLTWAQAAQFTWTGLEAV